MFLRHVSNFEIVPEVSKSAEKHNLGFPYSPGLAGHRVSWS